jgi:hypothetical protein
MGLKQILKTPIRRSVKISILFLVSLPVLAGILVLHESGIVPLYKSFPNWAIGICDGDSPFHLTCPDSRNPVLTARDVTDLKADYVADPFMVYEGNQYYMFFEVMDSESKKPSISVAVSSDGIIWKYLKVVLDEPFILSYPYVFKWDGNYYMVPETHQKKAVRLYRASDFPYGWKFVKTLVEGRPFSDPSIIYFEGRWWLFVSEGDDTLRLFHADKLFGPWVEHPKSPIIENDATRARPGGRPLIFNDKLFRFTQDDVPYYGRQIRVFKIVTLSVTDYIETEIPESPILGGTGHGWNKRAMHNIDLHQKTEKQWIACVDGYQRRERAIDLSWNFRRLIKAVK